MKLFLAILLFSTALFAKEYKIKVNDMTCPLCTMAIKKSLKKLKGVSKVKVKLNKKMATVEVNEDINKTILLDAVKKAGYTGVFVESNITKP